MAKHRIERISEEVKKELSQVIKNNIKDPRLSEFVTVTYVNVTGDLRYAKAYISVMGTEEEKNNSIKALKSAAGFIRHEIGSRIDLRYTPEFIFELDNSIENGINISKIIKDINSHDGE
jgi:ribosome-binding factor A